VCRQAERRHVGLARRCTKFLAPLTTVLKVAAYLAPAGVPTKVTYVPDDTVSATMAKGGAIIEDMEN
jgi:hypothetical protein